MVTAEWKRAALLLSPHRFCTGGTVGRVRHKAHVRGCGSGLCEDTLRSSTVMI
jgi:hypothetical protein